jgi:hypothetical protein
MEFSGFYELGQKNKILLLKNNLRGYSDCRKRYYDQKDEWLKKYRNQVGKATQYKGILEGTADYYFEQLKKIYFCDLTGWETSFPAAISFMRHLPIGLNPFKALFS